MGNYMGWKMIVQVVVENYGLKVILHSERKF